MEMIWHDREFVQFDKFKTNCQLHPDGFNHPSCLIQNHFSVYHISKQALPI